MHSLRLASSCSQLGLQAPRAVPVQAGDWACGSAERPAEQPGRRATSRARWPARGLARVRRRPSLGGRASSARRAHGRGRVARWGEGGSGRSVLWGALPRRRCSCPSRGGGRDWVGRCASSMVELVLLRCGLDRLLVNLAVVLVRLLDLINHRWRRWRRCTQIKTIINSGL